MQATNTPEEVEFFRAISEDDAVRVRTILAEDRSLLNSFNCREFGATPLTMACFNNRPKLVEVLIELGADPNRKSEWSMGPWSPLHCAIFRQNKTLAEYLLAHGAILDVHTAAGLGRCEDVAHLLDADPSRVLERGGDGCHPLHFADNVDAAQLLLDRGAEIDGRCVDHYSTPAQYLCSTRPEVTRFLFLRGAIPDIFTAAVCGDVQVVEKLLNADKNQIDARINQSFFPPGSGQIVDNILTFTVGQNATPLHAAARGNQRDTISILVRRGLTPNVRGGYDQATPLHVAAWNNCLRSAEALLDNGADINARSGKLHNNSPAGWAIVSGSADVFELLMDRGAECHSWFLDDARDAVVGRFSQVSSATYDQRNRILSRLNGSK